MAIASGSGARVAYVAESTPGTTPATPTFKVLRTTGGGLSATKSVAVSEEIRQDRNVADEILTGVDAGGSYNFELSYGSFDDILESALSGTWTTNVLKNGLTRKYFTFEETLETGATDSFFRFPMSAVNGFSLDITARERITGSFDVFSQQETNATAIITGATYTAANTKDVMSASNSVGTLTISGVTSPKVRRLSLQTTNNFRRRPVVANLYSEEYGDGRFEATGTLEIYFEDTALAATVLAHGTAALTATIGHVTAEKYTLSMPKIRFGDGAHRIGGNNDDIMMSVPFRAVYDSGIAASLQITRAVT